MLKTHYKNCYRLKENAICEKYVHQGSYTHMSTRAYISDRKILWTKLYTPRLWFIFKIIIIFFFTFYENELKRIYSSVLGVPQKNLKDSINRPYLKIWHNILWRNSFFLRTFLTKSSVKICYFIIIAHKHSRYI